MRGFKRINLLRRPLLGAILTISTSNLIVHTENNQTNQTRSKCPVSFLWSWSNEKPHLPLNHPKISNQTELTSNEEPIKYNKLHFPNGLNDNFVNIDKNSCELKYGGLNGLFECESRQIKKYGSNIIKTLQSYGLNVGSCVGDIGAGTGVMTRLLSKVVGLNGTVIAEEISPSFLTLLNEQKQKDSTLNNVIIIQGNDKEICFPSDKKCDLILVCDVYHHFEYPITICRYEIDQYLSFILFITFSPHHTLKF